MAPLALTDAGLVVAATLAAKVIAIVSFALTLLTTAPLYVTLTAAGKLGMPKLIVHLTLLTYRYVFLLLAEFNRLRIALRVRGFRNRVTLHAYRTVGQVTGTLLVRVRRSRRARWRKRCAAGRSTAVFGA